MGNVPLYYMQVVARGMPCVWPGKYHAQAVTPVCISGPIEIELHISCFGHAKCTPEALAVQAWRISKGTVTMG